MVRFGKQSALGTIGRDAFRESGLAAFGAPAGLRSVGQGAFSGCKGLKKATFGERLKTLGDEAVAGQQGVFEGSGIVSITLPTDLHKLAARTFQGCEDLHEFAFPVQLEAIGEQCFSGSGLEIAVFPGAVKNVGKGAFSGCVKLVTASAAPDGNLERLAEGAFEGTAIREFKAPNSLKFIGERVFAGCINLADVELNEGLGTVEADAFARTAFRTVILPSTVRRTGNKLFSNSRLQTAYYFQDAVKTQDSGIEWKMIPALSTMVGARPLGAYRGVVELELPDGLGIIGDGWFTGCVHMKSAVIPATVTEIGREAFYDCEHLSSVVFKGQSQLRSIEAGAFYIAGVERLDLPATLERIGDGAFYGCAALKEMVLKEGARLGEIGNAAFQNSGLTSFSAPDQLRVIGSSAFADCRSLKTVLLNWGLEKVGE